MEMDSSLFRSHVKLFLEAYYRVESFLARLDGHYLHLEPNSTSNNEYGK